MARSWFASVLVAALGILAAATARASEVFIRLVDAARNTPLEFLDCDLEQPALGHPLRSRMPRAVFVDGQAWALARFGRQDVDLKPDEKPAAGLEDLERELGALPSDETEVRSDRATEVLAGNGPKALAAGKLEDGEHTLHPGGIRFKVQGGHVADPVTAPLARRGPTTLALACLPVELNLVPAAPAALPIAVAVRSGPHTVYQELLPARPVLALRLYLPPSAEGYTVRLGETIEFAFALATNGVRLAGAPTLPPGVALEADGFTLGLAPAAGVPAARAPAAPPPGLYLFTGRSRSVFVEGERVQVSIRAFPAQAEDRATLSLASGAETLDLGTVPLRRAGPCAAAEVELDTRLLRPGRYTLRATAGGLRSNELPLTVAPLLPPTNMKLFAYHKWASSAYEPESLQPAALFGLNLLAQPVATSTPRPPPPPRDAALPELAAPIPRQATAAEFLLQHGIEATPIASGLILYFNVGPFWRAHADDRYQSVQYLAQQWRPYPNFRGIVHCTGDGPTPATLGTVFAAGPGSFDIIHDQRLKKLREVFEFKVGKLQLDDSALKAEFERINSQMQGAIGFGVGMDAGARVVGDDAVKVEWARWLCDLYPDNFREQRKALAALIPSPIVTSAHTWGPGARSGMAEETFYRDLDAPVTDLHGDYGIMPFSYVSGSDVLCAGTGKRPWVSLDLLPERTFANGLLQFLEGLSRNPAGIGALNVNGSLVAGGWSQQKRPSEGMMTLVEIARRFGDLYSTLNRRDEIGVLASFRQDALDGQSRVWGSHFLATKAGYQATVLTEGECLRDTNALARVRALFLPGLTQPLPAALRERLAAYQKAGGVLIADEITKLDLPGVVRVKSAETIFANQVDFREAYERFEPLIEPFREAVQPQLTPYFESSQRHVHLVRSTDGDLEYWTLFNDTLLGKTENPNGHFIQFLYKGVEADLAARATGTLYDALRRAPVAARAEGGALRWHADLRLLPGTVYLLAPRPITALAVTAGRQTAPGSLIRLRAEAQDADGRAFTGRLPVEFVVRDPAGVERYRLYRTTRCDVLLKIAGNDPAGRWTWTATDQATGLAAEGGFTVAGAATPPALTALGELVYDAPAIAAALRSREFDVILTPAQLALREPAERLAEGLRDAGAKARVRILWPTQERLALMNWNAHTVEDELREADLLAGRIAGLRATGKNQFGNFSESKENAFYKQFHPGADWVLYRDTILLGRADAPGNPLLDAVAVRNPLLPRSPSPNFPAPGQGLVAYAWGPFHYGHDAIVVYGADAPGLDHAAVALLRLAATPTPPPAPPPVWRATNELGQTYAAQGLNAAPGDTATVVGRERGAASLLPAVFDQRVTAARRDAGTLLVSQEPLSDPLGPRFATVDLMAATARLVNSTAPEFRRATLDQFHRSTPERLAAPIIVHTPEGRILPLGHGVALVDAQNAVKWHFDPFPAPRNTAEAQYPRLCHRLALSADNQWLLASFFDLGAGANYGPSYRQFNDAALVLLNAKTGQEVGRTLGYIASQLAIADDGSRAFVVDDNDYEGGRSRWNPHGGPAVAALDRKGKELGSLVGLDAERLAISRNGKLAAVSYNNTGRRVRLLRVDEGEEISVEYPRIDVGIAVADDGSAAAISYADGVLRKVEPTGKIVWDKPMPTPGVPVFLADGTVALCGDDGAVHFAEVERPSIRFAAAQTDVWSAPLEQPPPGLLAPSPPSWSLLRGDFAPVPLPTPPAPSLARFTGEKSLTLDLPALERLDVALLTFRYRLDSTGDTLRVSTAVGGRNADYVFPYPAVPRAATLGLRPAAAGPATLTFRATGGGGVEGLQLLRLKLSEFDNAARAGVTQKGGNVNTPQVLVPNVHGALGDPRVEQVAHGFPAQARGPLPPDLKGPQKTDPFSYFDGDVLAGTPLYPTVFPGQAPWNPVESRPTLRSAQLVLEYAKPRTVRAAAVWEHPSDRPVSAFVLEYCDDARPGALKSLEGSWQIAVEGHDNADYFHLHAFDTPISARYWRYTVLETPCPVQRIAELELLESALDSMDLDAAPVATDLP